MLSVIPSLARLSLIRTVASSSKRSPAETGTVTVKPSGTCACANSSRAFSRLVSYGQNSSTYPRMLFGTQLRKRSASPWVTTCSSVSYGMAHAMARRKCILLNGALRHVIPNHHPLELGYEVTLTPEALRKSGMSLVEICMAKSTSPRSRTMRRVEASGTTCRIMRSSLEGWTAWGLGTRLIIEPFCQVSMTNGPDEIVLVSNHLSP